MPTTIQVRRSTQNEWNTNSFGVVLLAGEVGYETDTGNIKIGDGSTTWANLKYQLPYNTGSRDSALPATLTIDNANDRVGIGESSPTEKLSVGGNATISGTLAVTGNTTLAGDLAVNGGDITTTSGTLNVASTLTSAQTVNVAAGVTASGSTKAINIGTGGASGSTTNVNIGSSTSGATGTTAIARNATIGGTLSVTGTTALTGDVTLTGDLAVNGGDITTSSATANVFNSGALTLNIGQAATSVSIGATGTGSGTTTIRNATTAISGAATVGGTLGVTGALTATGGINAVTFNGTPSWASDPTNANDLSRRSWVLGLPRIGQKFSYVSISSTTTIKPGDLEVGEVRIYNVSGNQSVGLFVQGDVTKPGSIVGFGSAYSGISQFGSRIFVSQSTTTGLIRAVMAFNTSGQAIAEADDWTTSNTGVLARGGDSCVIMRIA